MNDIGLTKIVIHGGYVLESSTILNDLWIFDVEAVSWSQGSTQSPVSLYSHVLAYSPVHGRYFVHGGLTTGESLNREFYHFKLENDNSYTLESVNNNPPYSVHSHSGVIFHDLYSNNISFVVSGGFNSTSRTNPVSLVWSFACDGNTVPSTPPFFSRCEWRDLSSVYAPARVAAHRSLYNPVTSEMLLFGGSSEAGSAVASSYSWTLPSSDPLTWEKRLSHSLNTAAVYPAVFPMYKSENYALTIIYGGAIGLDPYARNVLNDTIQYASFFSGSLPTLELFGPAPRPPPDQIFLDPIPSFSLGSGIEISNYTALRLDSIDYQPKPVDGGAVGAGVAIPIILLALAGAFFYYARNNPEQFRDVPVLHGLLPPPGSKPKQSKREGGGIPLIPRPMMNQNQMPPQMAGPGRPRPPQQMPPNMRPGGRAPQQGPPQGYVNGPPRPSGPPGPQFRPGFRP